MRLAQVKPITHECAVIDDFIDVGHTDQVRQYIEFSAISYWHHLVVNATEDRHEWWLAVTNNVPLWCAHEFDMHYIARPLVGTNPSVD